MAIRQNRYFNDPNIGAAFSSLAQIFAPPSAQDAAAYAVANAKRAEAQRAQDLYNYASDPSFDQTMFDRRGIAAGVWNPSQGYHALDLNAATTRRGQDVSAAASRYGSDRSFEASRLNNTADNARALEQTRLGNTKDITVSMLAPVADGATRFVPPSIASMYGTPETQVGTLSAAQGETIVAPNGQTLNGAPKPMSETEVKGAERQRLSQSGLLTDQMILDTVLGAETPVMALGADGKPRYQSPGAAVREGAQPYIKPTADNATEISRLIAERDALPPGDPNRAAFDQRIQALGRGQQQSAYDKQTDEDFAKLNTQISADAMGAAGDRMALSRLQHAVADPATEFGALGDLKLQIRKYAAALGVPVSDTSEPEMINALGNQLALRLRDPSNGAGMPGALSDSDREFLKSMTISLGNSREANRKLLAYYFKMQQKKADLEDLRSRYVQERGRLDEGFRPVVSNYLSRLYSRDPAIEGGQLAADAQQSAAPEGPVRVNTPEEAAALPPGTRFMTPDGRMKVRP